MTRTTPHSRGSLTISSCTGTQQNCSHLIVDFFAHVYRVDRRDDVRTVAANMSRGRSYKRVALYTSVVIRLSTGLWGVHAGTLPTAASRQLRSHLRRSKSQPQRVLDTRVRYWRVAP